MSAPAGVEKRWIGRLAALVMLVMAAVTRGEAFR
jgi:hypothetical protein